MYYIHTASAKDCGGWGPYKKVYVLELNKYEVFFKKLAGEPVKVKAADERHKLVDKVIWCSGKVFVGKTENCAYAYALKEAQDKVNELLGEKYVS